MNETLNNLTLMIQELEEHSSVLKKKEILKKYLDDEQLARLVWYTYNPFQKFHITSKNAEKQKEKLNVSEIEPCNNFTDFLDLLVAEKLSGYTALTHLVYWTEKYPEHKDLLYKIVDKDLKCRVNVSLINKVKKDFIPEFKVALANKYDEKTTKLLSKGQWFISRKLDGVRCICMKDKHGVRFFSRTGHQFYTLDKVIPDIHKLAEDLGKDEFVLDGEICLLKDGREDFQGIMKEITRKDHTIEKPVYKLFDLLSLEGFLKAHEKTSFDKRMSQLTKVIEPGGDFYGNTLSLLVQYPYNEKMFDKLKVMSSEWNWEGLMLRKDDSYKGKRSNDILKVKSFSDGEYEVLDVELGKMRIVEDGSEKEIEALSAVIIEHNGHKVKVGSGFDVSERKRFFDNPEEIIGKIITVQYFEETTNQKGEGSLRFPTVKVIHGYERNT